MTVGDFLLPLMVCAGLGYLLAKFLDKFFKHLKTKKVNEDYDKNCELLEMYTENSLGIHMYIGDDEID